MIWRREAAQAAAAAAGQLPTAIALLPQETTDTQLCLFPCWDCFDCSVPLSLIPEV